MAYGPLGLKPDELWRLTPIEFFQMQNGHHERDKLEHSSRSFFMAHAIRSLGQFKSPPRVDTMYRRFMKFVERANPKKKSKKKKRARRREIIERAAEWRKAEEAAGRLKPRLIHGAS